jgi:phosphotransferase system enzyme I (PtsI)
MAESWARGESADGFMTEKRQTAGWIEGEGVSPGLAKGCLVLLVAETRRKRRIASHDAEREVARFRTRIARLSDRLARDIQQLRQDGLTAEAEVVETHLFLLRDRTFQQKVEHLVRSNEVAAGVAVEEVLGEMVEQLERSDNILFAERSADVRDIIRGLQEQREQEQAALFATLRQIQNPVLAVPELLPSLVLEARHSGLGGFVVERGTAFSHAAILAKSFGIPVLRIDRLARLKSADRRPVLVDAVQGRLLIEPSPEEEATAEADVREEREVPARESPIRIWVNIVDPAQITQELSGSVAGVGLYRTEMLFMQARREFPDEEHEVLHSFYPAGPASPPQVGGEYLDPVCGMVVDPEETPFALASDSGRVHFCSRRCEDEYLHGWEHEDGAM